MRMRYLDKSVNSKVLNLLLNNCIKKYNNQVTLLIVILFIFSEKLSNGKM